MRIRTLVPALACLAAAPLATAADGPAVKFDGFVDTIYSITNNEETTATSGFDYAGKLGVSATISEKVSAQVDLNIGNDGNVFSRQTFGVWKIADEMELKTGKFISNYGWTAAYAPGLYRINGGIITRFYGVDQSGVDFKYTAPGGIVAAVTVANGFFGEGDGSGEQDPTAPPQDNEAYAIGLDVVAPLGEMGSVNAELIRDEDVGAGEDGDGIHFGLNATLTPTKELTVAAEYIYQLVNDTDGTDDVTHNGAMILANLKLATAMPMSVTGQASYVDVDDGDVDSVTVQEFALALLTNPAGTDKLGANLEVNYTTERDAAGDSVYAIGLAGEILYVF